MFRSVSVSFCVITNGKRPKKLRALVDSVERLGIPEYEIVVVGYLAAVPEGVIYIEDFEGAHTGKLGKMRNRACREASKDILVVVDDDVSFAVDFYEHLQRLGLQFDVLLTAVLNPDGSRYWDWAISNELEHVLIPYEQTHSDVYITGGRCIMRPKVFQAVQWDDEIGFYHGEDLDFSSKIRKAGFQMMMCKELVIYHNDWRYTQRGNKVRNYGVLKSLLRSIARKLGVVDDVF